MPGQHGARASERSRRLVLVRHGRTAWNAVRRAQGHADVGLDDVGRAEAQRAGPYLAALQPVRLWTSDLARASQTAAYVTRHSGVPAEPDARLREYSVGARAGLTMAEFAERFPAAYAAWERGDESGRVAGAESTAEVLARMVPALHEYLAALDDGQTGMAVTHGACLRACMLALLDLPPSADGAFAIMGNCTWTTLQQAETGGRVRLLRYNEGVTEREFASVDRAR